jgi:hypothetical protein
MVICVLLLALSLALVDRVLSTRPVIDEAVDRG